VTVNSEQERRDRAWEEESAEQFVERVQALVTEEPDPVKRAQNLRDLRLSYETRAQFFVELEEQLGEGTVGTEAPLPGRDEIEQLLIDVTEEYMAAEDASEPFISIGIIHQLDERSE
jgi:hypothetical protein